MVQHADIDHTGITGAGGTWADLDDDHDAHDHTGVPGVGGSGAARTLAIDLPGSSLTGTTSINSGTWASVGGVIEQQSAGAASRWLQVDAKIPGGDCLAEAELWHPAAAAEGFGGIVIGHDGSANLGDILVRLDTANQQLQVFGASQVKVYAATITDDTWYKLRLHAIDSLVTIWLAGTLIGTVQANPNMLLRDNLALYAFGVYHFRNVKGWTPTLPA